jgi:hypothetical protein
MHRGEGHVFDSWPWLAPLILKFSGPRGLAEIPSLLSPSNIGFHENLR